MRIVGNPGPAEFGRAFPWRRHDATVAGWPDHLREAYDRAMTHTVNPAEMAETLVSMVADARHRRVRPLTAAAWCRGKEARRVAEFAATLANARGSVPRRDTFRSRGAPRCSPPGRVASEVVDLIDGRSFYDGASTGLVDGQSEGFEPRTTGNDCVMQQAPAGLVLHIRRPDGTVTGRPVVGFNSGGSPVVVGDDGGSRLLDGAERVLDATVAALTPAL